MNTLHGTAEQPQTRTRRGKCRYLPHFSSIQCNRPIISMNQNRGLHGFPLFRASCTCFLIIAGALVTGNDAGLAVPDWRLSYGSLAPPMVGGIFYEHSHRRVASFVGFLTEPLFSQHQIEPS
jgi:hypothetical protein